MRKTMGFVLILFVICGFAYSEEKVDILKEVDSLHEASKHAEAKELLLQNIPRLVYSNDKCEYYWRLARETLGLGDDAEEQGQKMEDILKFFEEGEKFADQAIKFDKNNPAGYFWKSANIGRWGQVKGIFDSLGKAEPMSVELKQAITVDPAYADAYYTLGVLYDLLPGWPLSFGNIEYAVSLARKSIDVHEKDLASGKENKVSYVYYIELATHLAKRNWSARTRTGKLKYLKENYESKKDVLEKNFFYEAAVTLKDMSDKEEAKEIINWVIKEMSAIPDRSKYDEKDLKKAKEVKDTHKL
ncbi:MAG: hypothetical protein JW969_19640 [Spirochaetales bacterium]|nr:hypothetical protein [Spirochaetales bacterium]